MAKLVVLATGGTIAGVAQGPGEDAPYCAGQLHVDTLLASVPALSQSLGGHDVVAEQVFQIDSKDMGPSYWLALLERLQHHISQADVAGVVVTHGTDTLEETAYFLSQVLPQDVLAHKPVVLTCAMRPATSAQADGPANLRDAVRVARDAQARGVLAVCAGQVHSALWIQKMHPTSLQAFSSGDQPPLALVAGDAVQWSQPCPASDGRGPVPSVLPPAGAWPRVEIVLSHAGADGALVRALCRAPEGADAPVQGLVVACTGNGTVHADLATALGHARMAGVTVWRTTRCPLTGLQAGQAGDDLPVARGLSPVKARIALMLELMAR